LERVLKRIQRAQANMWATDVAGVVRNGREEAVKAAQESADALTRELWSRLPERQAESLDRAFRVSAGEGVGTTRQRRELSARVVGAGRMSQRRLDAIIQSALTRQLNAEELAREVYDHISPSVPGGASYAAMRIARTEINNAFHQQQIAQGQRPGVEAVEWNLSGSHKVPDECNVYAAKREYPPDAVPDKPHPQCLCYLTYKMATVDDFLAALEAGDFDEVLGAAADPEPEPEPPPAKTSPKRAVPRNDRIERSVASGVESSEKLTGGVSAQTSKVKFKDGTVGVRKVIDNASAKHQQDAEELVSMLARMMGLPAPEVARLNENTTVQQFLRGEIAASALPWVVNAGTPQAKKLSASARVKSYVESDTGWLMAVMDQVVGNQDRNDGNWLTGEDGEITGVIDHGLAYMIRDWRTKQHNRMDLSEAYIFRTKSEFTKRFAKANGEQTNIDLHPEDLDAIEEMMTALRSEYEARGRLEWWEFSMKQIEALRPYAKGKKRRIT